ncbi:hypothetical protein L0222_24645 [bacterium]|nr:hypothetical protein [bacterium]
MKKQIQNARMLSKKERYYENVVPSFHEAKDFDSAFWKETTLCTLGVRSLNCGDADFWQG